MDVITVSARAAQRIGDILKQEAAGHHAAPQRGGRRLFGLSVTSSTWIATRPSTTPSSVAKTRVVLVDQVSLQFFSPAPRSTSSTT